MHIMKDEISIRKSSVEDAIELAPRLRIEDRREIELRFAVSPESMLPLMIMSRSNRKAFTIRWGAEAHGIFGVDEISNGLGCPWFLSSRSLIENHKKRFVSESRHWLLELESGYATFENFILAENLTHIRWIQSLGFKLIEHHEDYGAAKVPFWKFQKTINAARLI